MGCSRDVWGMDGVGSSAVVDGGSRLLDADEVAVLLGVPRTWVYAETRADRLPHIVVGRYRRYRREAIEAWISAHERGPLTAEPGGRFTRPDHTSTGALTDATRR